MHKPELDAAEVVARAPKQHFIGGKWVPALSGKVFSSINPSTGEVVAELAAGDSVDIDRAVASARAALNGPWRNYTPAQRQNVLLQFADLVASRMDEFRLLDATDMGFPIGRPPGASTSMAVEVLRYYAGWPTKIHGETVPTSRDSMFSYTLRQPVGVVGALIPWNGPLGAAIWKLAPVLATGCTVVLKPAEEAGLSPLRLCELIEEVDLPPGVVNVVTGYGETAGAALAAHPGVDKIAFTGSSVTAQKVVRAAATNLKRVSLELGGKSPNIIFQDTDLSVAVPAAAMAVFPNAGQVCCAGTRVFVEQAIYDEFVVGLAEVAKSLKVGHSLDRETEIGPIVSQAQLDRVTGYLALGIEEGARPVAGGTRLTGAGLSDGYFVAPTVFADVTDDMQIARDEIFGPVASVLPFQDPEEVIGRANGTEFGLAAAVWTRDVGKAHRLAQALDAGVVWVNTYGQFDPAMPFGGNKMSGWGRELSIHSLEEYLNVKSVWINTA